MADSPYDEGSESVTRSEHISPIKTGDNIEAKRAANYVWDGTSTWVRMTQPGGSGGGSSGNVGIDPVGQNGVNYDSIVYTNTSATVDTYVYKTGGTSGTTTATVTITYVDSTKAQVSTVVRT